MKILHRDLNEIEKKTNKYRLINLYRKHTHVMKFCVAVDNHLNSNENETKRIEDFTLNANKRVISDFKKIYI